MQRLVSPLALSRFTRTVRFQSTRKDAGVRVILLEEIPGTGMVGDVVAVRPGRARNYLVPFKKAAYLTTENYNKYKDIVQQSQQLHAVIKEDTERREKMEQEELKQLELTYNERYLQGLESMIAESRSRSRGKKSLF